MEEDFTNKSIWKKQVSQDGREYYVNLVTGNIKYPPKQNEKKLEIDTKKSSNSSNSTGHSDDHYIQQYTVDKVPFFVNMRSGVSLWTLPEGTPLTAVKYITHLTAEGIPYYEDTEKKTTSWTLPVEKLSTSARRSSVALVKMNRRQSNVFMASINQENSSPTTPQATIEETPKDHETANSDGEGGRSDGDGGGLFKPRVRTRTPNQTGGKKSTTQPRRLSNMAQRSQQQSAPENPSNQNQKGVVGMNDARSIRANQRQQSISKLTNPSPDGNDSDQSNDSIKLAANKKPFTQDPNRDSPTISDVSSVTAASHPGPATTGNPEVVGGAIETKPLVRTMFEKYEKSKSGWISMSGLQELCYDFGTFLSQDELKLAISEIDMDRDGKLSYEEFMVWWRTNDQFSTMKLSDAHTKMRTDCAAVYKRYDRKMLGEVSRQEFGKIHRELIREKLVKIDLDTLVSILDPKGDGVVFFNDFISWVERGQTHSTDKPTSESVPKQKSLAKFFGSLLGGSQDPEPQVAQNTNLVQAKDHQDYAKYFRMASMGGNIMDIRKQMREAGLDENIIHTPEKLIPKQSKISQNDHLKQATMMKGESATFGSLLHSTDFHDDESDGKSTVASSVHVDDREFTGMFKKKPATRPSITVPTLIEVYLSKPLGITLGENVEDEEKGVHVSSCAPGGNAANTGLIEPGMLLIEACGEDVRFRDFDSVMDILRGAPAGEKIKLLFSKPVEVPQMAGDDEAGDSDVSETSSVDKSIQSVKPSVAAALLLQSHSDPNDSDESETSSLDKSVKPSSIPGTKNVVSQEPNDSDVSETSSVDRSVVQLKSQPPEVQPESTQIELNVPKRRDSNKSVESVASTISQNSQTSVVSKVSTKSNISLQPKNSENITKDQSLVPPIVEVIPPTEEKPDIATQNSTQPTGRSSFAMRKAAAIRNAAARRKETPKPQSETVAAHPSESQDQTPNVSSLPRGVFGISQNSSDSDDDDPPPILPNAAQEKRLQHFESHEWKDQEPVVSIPNPHLSILQEQHSPETPSLENSEIIGRPRAPRKNLPSILNRIKRQQSNDSTGEKKPERGGIARMASRPIPESLAASDTPLSVTPPLQIVQSIPAVPLHQPTVMMSAMNDIGSTGTGKVPLPANLLGNMGQINSNQGKEVVSNPISDRSTQNSISSQSFQPQQTNQQTTLIDSDNEEDPDRVSPTHDSGSSPIGQRARRATPLGRHRGMRKFTSKQPTQVESSSSDLSSKPFTEKASIQALTIPSPQTITKQRREELSSRNQVVDSDPDSDHSFSPQLVQKTLAPYRSQWNESPLSVPKLGVPGSNSSLTRVDISESESSQSQIARGYQPHDLRQIQRPATTSRGVKTVDAGVQSDYVAYIDEQYLNSYQMLLGERQKLEYMQEVFRIECEERLEMLHEEELSMMDRIRQREEESYQRMHDEENQLALRVQEVEDIIMNEKEDILRQWDDLHHAENESHETHRQRTAELLELLHIVRAHHDKLQADKKKIGRQRLQLDMALQDLNKFTHFNPSPEGKLSRRQNYSPSPRSTSPAPYHTQNSMWSHGRPMSSPSRAPSRERSFGSTR